MPAGSEYPKNLHKKGQNDGFRAENADDERRGLAAGWSLTPDPPEWAVPKAGGAVAAADEAPAKPKRSRAKK